MSSLSISRWLPGHPRHTKGHSVHCILLSNYTLYIPFRNTDLTSVTVQDFCIVNSFCLQSWIGYLSAFQIHGLPFDFHIVFSLQRFKLFCDNSHFMLTGFSVFTLIRSCRLHCFCKFVCVGLFPQHVLFLLWLSVRFHLQTPVFCWFLDYSVF